MVLEMPAHQSMSPGLISLATTALCAPTPHKAVAFLSIPLAQSNPQITLTSTVMLAKARALQGHEIQVSGWSQLRNRNCAFWPSAFTSLVHHKAVKGAKTAASWGKAIPILQLGLSFKFLFPSCELLCICAAQPRSHTVMPVSGVLQNAGGLVFLFLVLIFFYLETFW